MTVEQLWQPVPGGSGTYIRALAEALTMLDDVEVTGIRARGPVLPDAGLPEAMDLVASRLPRAALYEGWTRLRRPHARRSSALRGRGGRYDVVHATTWAIPPRSAPLVVTVHDVAFLRQPEHFTPRGVRFFERSLAIARNEADVVVVPSEVSRQDCIAAGFDAERVRVIHHGTRPHHRDAAQVAAFRAAHGLTRDFILWCGTFEPRKNLSTLLAAYRVLLAAGSDLDLVLVGPAGWGGISGDVHAAVASLPADRVHLLGRLDEDELQAAYAAARAFCFPSLWEGFGMPVLEAMVHGTPVVTSGGTSMQEISGAGALLVDPLDVDELADALARAVGEEHDALSSAARGNAARYTWEASVRAHVAAYRDAIASSGRRS
jgi:glycosyltransferase involved in cell wall biosynthesis